MSEPVSYTHLDVYKRQVHTVLIGQYTQLQPTLDDKNFPDNGYKTISLGAIRMQASLKDRLWVYGAAIGMTESNETFFTPQPFLWGGAARMRIIGLRSQIVYGSILAYNQKLRVIPVFGVNQRLGKQWRATALLPFMADINYHPTKWFSMDALTGVNSYSGGFQVQTAEEKLLRRQNYQHAVSYTHLDVYKRQAAASPELSAREAGSIGQRTPAHGV